MEPPTEANAVARQWARKLAAKPLSALLETKRLLKTGQADLVAQRMAQEGDSFRRMLQEPAAKEAFAAFFEKRKNAVFVTLRGKKILRNFENRPPDPYFWGFVTIPLGKGFL